MLSIRELELALYAVRSARKSLLAESEAVFERLKSEPEADVDLASFNARFSTACDLGARSLDMGRLEQTLLRIFEEESDKYLNN